MAPEARSGAGRRRGPLAVGAAALLLAVAYSAYMGWPILMRAGQVGGSDFRWYYTAFWIVLHHVNPAQNLYAHQYFVAWMAARHFAFARSNVFGYPPTMALWFSWVAHWPYGAARQVWDVLMAACLLAAIALAGLMATPSWPVRFGLWAAALALYPVYSNFYWGQINPAVLLCMVMGLLLWSRGHPVWAGALLAAAALIKVTPAIILVAFLLAGHWRVVAGAAAAAAGAVATGAPFVGLRTFATYVGKALPALGRSTHPQAPWNQSLLGGFALAIHPPALALATFLVVALGCLAAAAVSLRRCPDGPPAVVALVSLLPLVCAPIVETHHFVLAILALCLVGALAWEGKGVRPRWPQVAAWGAAVLLLVVPTVGFQPQLGYSAAMGLLPLGPAGTVLEALQHVVALALLAGLSAYAALTAQPRGALGPSGG